MTFDFSQPQRTALAKAGRLLVRFSTKQALGQIVAITSLADSTKVWYLPVKKSPYPYEIHHVAIELPADNYTVQLMGQPNIRYITVMEARSSSMYDGEKYQTTLLW